MPVLLASVLGVGNAAWAQNPEPKPLSTKRTTPQSFDYQGIGWGATVDEVRRQFPALEKIGNSYSSHQTIDGRSAYLMFYFNENKLIEIIVALDFQTSTPNTGPGAVADYESLRALLIAKYGHPTQTLEQWTEPRWEQVLTRGDGLAKSLLKLSTIWKFGETEVLLFIGTNERNTIYKIHYSNTPAKIRMRESTKADALRKL